MNGFRVIADLLHLVAMMMLPMQIWRERSVRGRRRRSGRMIMHFIDKWVERGTNTFPGK